MFTSYTKDMDVPTVGKAVPLKPGNGSIPTDTKSTENQEGIPAIGKITTGPYSDPAVCGLLPEK